MELTYVPLLPVQRELQGLPRNPDRFQRYLRTMLGPDGVELPPLVLINPMGRDHITTLLDALLALDADEVAARTVAEAAAASPDIPGAFRIGLVVADDLMGGWTNRYGVEFGLRFGSTHGPFEPDPETPSGFRLPRWLQEFWLTSALWSSDPASIAAVREAILLTVHRFAYVNRHGPARTLRERMAQEGQVMAKAGCAGPVLDADDLAYTREVLGPWLDADDKRTGVECLFGDEAARSLGFTPRGLSPWAGLALALHDARRPEDAGARCSSASSG